MKAFLIGLLVGGVVAGVGVWILLSPDPEEVSALRERATELAVDAVEAAESTARTFGESLKERIQEWNLSPETLKEELKETGKVVRRKAEDLGESVADAAGDARITATVKAKLLRDSEISGWKISVETEDGVVTLRGTVDTAEQVSRVMALAMETDGVREVAAHLEIPEEKDTPDTK